MFSSNNRLSTPEVNRVFLKGKRVNSPLFQIVYLKVDEDYKVSVNVSKKISKSAVGRNLLKRRLCSIMKKHLPVLDGLWMVLLLKKNISKNELEGFESNFLKEVKKIKI